MIGIGINLALRQMSIGGGGEVTPDPYAAYIIYDSFDDTDGVAINAHSPEKGGSWVALSGTWTIQSDKAQPNTGGARRAAIDAGVADAVVRCKLTPFESGSNWSFAALAGRGADDSNLWFARINSQFNQLQLYRHVSGTSTSVIVGDAPAIVSGQEYELVMIFKGTQIIAYLTTDPTIIATSSVHQSNTLYGIIHQQSGSPATPSKFNDFSVSALTDYADFISAWSGAASLVSDDGMTADRQNGMPYRTSIASRNIGGTDYQVVSWWDSDRYLRVAVRTGYSGAWTEYTYGSGDDITIGPAELDNHNTTSIGIDPDGFLHLSHNHHGNPLNYRMSVNPLPTFDGTVTAGLDMLGTNETLVTYPMFFNDPSGQLYFAFRDGGSGGGDMYIYEYDEATEAWSGLTGATDGLVAEGQTASNNLYWYGPPKFDVAFGSGGLMHIAGHWRDTASANDNSQVSYLAWDGTNWLTADGSAQTMPATKSNISVIDSVGNNAGLSGFNSLDSDGNGNPHVVYVKNDGSSKAQIYHAWHNGTSWVTMAITSNTLVYSAGDTGLVRRSAPQIAIDRATNTAYVIYSQLNSGEGIYVLTSGAGDFAQWTLSTITDQRNGYSTPVYDRYRWQEDGVVSLHVAPFVYDVAGDQMPILVLEWTP